MPLPALAGPNHHHRPIQWIVLTVPIKSRRRATQLYTKKAQLSWAQKHNLPELRVRSLATDPIIIRSSTARQPVNTAARQSAATRKTRAQCARVKYDGTTQFHLGVHNAIISHPNAPIVLHQTSPSGDSASHPNNAAAAQILRVRHVSIKQHIVTCY